MEKVSRVSSTESSSQGGWAGYAKGHRGRIANLNDNSTTDYQGKIGSLGVDGLVLVRVHVEDGLLAGCCRG